MNNSLNPSNPFSNESNLSASYTNPSPFKLFKSQTPALSAASNPPPSQFVQPSNPQPFVPQTLPGSSTMFNSSSTNLPSFFSNPSPNTVYTPSSVANPATKDTLFTGNKELENKKNQILNKKRIQDLIDEWKDDFKKNLNQFFLLSEQVCTSEKSLKEIQKEVVLLQEYYFKIKSEQRKMEESIDVILAEQNDLNGALDVIDKELDNVLHTTGLYIALEDKENLYKSANTLSKGIDNAENQFMKMLKQVNTKQENLEGQDIQHTLDIFLETLDWIEKTVENITEKMNILEKEYKYLL
jgi:Nsp1-like C-terminal region